MTSVEQHKSPRLTRPALGVILGAALVLSALLLAPSALAHPTVDGWQMSALASDADLSAHPRLSDGRLVWVAQAPGGERKLRFTDATGVTRVLPGLPEKLTEPEIDGDHVVFMGEGWPWEVFVHTLSTGATQRLTTNSLFDFDVRIAGRLVVWRQTGEPGFEGADPGATSLLVHDLTDGGTRTLASGSPDSGLGDSAMSAEWVAWNRLPQVGLPEVWVYEAATGQTRQIPSLVGVQVLALAGRNLVCLGKPKPDSAVQELLAYDLEAGTTRVVVQDAAGYQSVRADGNLVAWAGWSEGSSYMALYDMDADRTTRVRTPGYSVGSLVLRNGLVIWQGQFGARFAGTYWSYLFTYDPARGVATRLSTVLAPNDGWDTDGRQIVFTDGNYWPYLPTGPLDLVLASPSSSSTGAFADVPGTQPHRTAITGLQERGIVTGYAGSDGDGSVFRPDGTLTRAQFAKMLALTMDVPVVDSLAAPFDDLGPDDPNSLFPHQYVAALAQAGVIQGTSQGSFSPYAPVTRAQMVTLTVRAVDRLQPGVLGFPPNDTFHDYIGAVGPFDPLHGPNVLRAEVNGLLDGLLGYGHSWDPWASATRGDGAMVLWNVLSKEGRPAPPE